MSKQKFWIRLMVIMMVAVTMFAFMTFFVGASNSTTYNIGSGWEILYHTADSAKPYAHLHFRHNGSEVYCLRLDNLSPCDGGGGSGGVPKWVMKEAQKIANSRAGWGYDIPKSTVSAGKILAIFGCAILIIIATICPFDGPAGDAAAWALLLGVAA